MTLPLANAPQCLTVDDLVGDSRRAFATLAQVWTGDELMIWGGGRDVVDPDGVPITCGDGCEPIPPPPLHEVYRDGAMIAPAF